MRVNSSESAANRALADTARAPRLACIDPAAIGRTRGAIRRHRVKRRARVLAVVLAAGALVATLATLESLADAGITATPDGAPYTVTAIRAAMVGM